MGYRLDLHSGKTKMTDLHSVSGKGNFVYKSPIQDVNCPTAALNRLMAEHRNAHAARTRTTAATVRQ